MTLAELRSGQIDHALAITIPYARAGCGGVARAAHRTATGSAAELPEGAHLRLNPRLNIPAMHLPKIVEMIALAAQRYGIIVRDQSHADIGFFAEDPTPYGAKPYGRPDPYYGVFGTPTARRIRAHGAPDPMPCSTACGPRTFFRYFPWRSLQVLKMSLALHHLTAAPSGPGKPQLYSRRVRRRVAFVDYFCPHYRRPLFEELARRMEMDFYFFSDARDKWWNSRLPTIEDGDFRRIALRRYRIAGEPFVPTLPLRLRPDRYDAVIKNLNGRLMLPSLYAAARLRRVPFVLWTGMWFHPQTAFHRLSRPITEALYRDVPAIVVYGEHVKRVLLEVPGVASEKIFVAGQAVDASRFADVQPSRNSPPVVLFVGQFEERKGIDDLLGGV